jgi:hypothetical protein
MKRFGLPLGAALLVSGSAFAACSGSTVTFTTDASTTDAASDSPGDPCLGVVLPACPRRCEAFPMTGACTAGDRCATSDVGDDCQCQGGSWQCAVHPPLGLGCNKVCRDLPPPVDAGADGGQPCDPNAKVKDPCGPTGYCKSTDCLTGVCAQKPPETANNESPVCGCDDVTYWNDNVAAARGMSVKATGVCKTGVKCGGPGPTRPCAAGFSCDMQVATAGGCGIQSAPGTCWALPATCPKILIGPVTRACAAPTCTGRCELIGKEATYYRDNTCPQ